MTNLACIRRLARCAARGALALLLVQSVSGGATRPASAQDTSFSETIAVDLVEIDILVTDGDGRPVLDLSAADFQVFDDGELVTVTHFAGPSGSSAGDRPSGSSETGSSFVVETLPRTSENFPRLVIFLDELRLNLRSRHLVLRRLGEALKKELSPRTEVMLASYSGSVNVLVPFTRDHQRIARALEKRLSGAAQAVMAGVAKERVLFNAKQLLEVQLESYVDLPGIGRQEFIDRVCEGDVAGFVRGYGQQAFGQIEAAIGALGQFVVSLAAYPGHKSLLYVSDGVPLVAGQEVWDYAIELCDGSALNRGTVSGRSIIAQFPPARRFPITARSELQQLNTHKRWTALAAAANSRRVTLNSLQASGLEGSRAASVDGARTSFATESMGRYNRQETLVTMAEETGGRAILNANDATPAIGALLEAEAARYILAFPSRHPIDGASHKLQVEVLRPGLESRFRKSYESTSPDQQVMDRISASLYHGFEDDTHGLRVTATRHEGRKVIVEVQVPLSSLVLLPDEGGLRGLVTIFAAALDSAGHGTSVRQKSIPIQAAPGAGRGTYRVQVAMELNRSREHTVAVALRDELGGTISFVRELVAPE